MDFICFTEKYQQKKTNCIRDLLKNQQLLIIETYKKYRNKLNTLLRLAKQSYYCDLLDQEKNNIKNTWKVLNSIISFQNKAFALKNLFQIMQPILVPYKLLRTLINTLLT